MEGGDGDGGGAIFVFGCAISGLPDSESVVGRLCDRIEVDDRIGGD